MLLSVHVIAGAAISLAVRQPVLSAPIAFATHIVLDAVPHWNYPVPRERTLRSFWKSFGPDMLVTILVTLGLVVWFWDMWPLVVWGVAWAALPDFLTLYRKTKPWSIWLRAYYKMHNAAQWEVARGPGLTIQAFFTFLLVLLLGTLH